MRVNSRKNLNLKNKFHTPFNRLKVSLLAIPGAKTLVIFIRGSL